VLFDLGALRPDRSKRPNRLTRGASRLAAGEQSGGGAASASNRHASTQAASKPAGVARPGQGDDPIGLAHHTAGADLAGGESSRCFTPRLSGQGAETARAVPGVQGMPAPTRTHPGNGEPLLKAGAGHCISSGAAPGCSAGGRRGRRAELMLGRRAAAASHNCGCAAGTARSWSKADAASPGRGRRPAGTSGRSGTSGARHHLGLVAVEGDNPRTAVTELQGTGFWRKLLIPAAQTPRRVASRGLEGLLPSRHTTTFHSLGWRSGQVDPDSGPGCRTERAANTRVP